MNEQHQYQVATNSFQKSNVLLENFQERLSALSGIKQQIEQHEKSIQTDAQQIRDLREQLSALVQSMKEVCTTVQDSTKLATDFVTTLQDISKDLPTLHDQLGTKIHDVQSKLQEIRDHIDHKIKQTEDALTQSMQDNIKKLQLSVEEFSQSNTSLIKDEFSVQAKKQDEQHQAMVQFISSRFEKLYPLLIIATLSFLGIFLLLLMKRS